jgi:hypothetical protein
MIFKKEYRNIYLVAAIIVAAFAFMAISTWDVFTSISGQTSVDLAIDRQVDKCWADNNLDK